MANLGNWLGSMFRQGNISSREAQAAKKISDEIGRYLGRTGLIDSDGFYISDEVHGTFPFDLSSFSALEIKQILWLVRRRPMSVRVSPKYNASKRTISFTIKVR